MSDRHFVIIGNGPAANSAAETLREKDAGARITLIDRDRTGYYRSNLLPRFVSGELSEDRIRARPTEHYAKAGIKLRLGQEVRRVDFDAREVVLNHKEKLGYDGLIIAVGGKPRIPEPLLVFEDLLLTLKTAADARKWMKALAHTDSVLIVGGDLTSLSFTSALVKMGKKVRFILNEDSFWPVRYDDAIHAQVSAKLAEKGVETLKCRKLRWLALKSPYCIEVETDAEKFETGVVGAFYGLVPDVKFLARSGLMIERGILVDEYLKTCIDSVYAAGDCAQVYHPGMRDYWVSIGYANAKNLGKTAALNMLGAHVKAEAAPRSIFEMDGIVVNTSWWTEF
jgi:NADPH-dependent 2,4-dienoyl-CoA reductase/sulfur reductase-like enzyme